MLRSRKFLKDLLLAYPLSYTAAKRFCRTSFGIRRSAIRPIRNFIHVPLQFYYSAYPNSSWIFLKTSRSRGADGNVGSLLADSALCLNPQQPSRCVLPGIFSSLCSLQSNHGS